MGQSHSFLYIDVRNFRSSKFKVQFLECYFM